MSHVKFDATDDELALVKQIVERAKAGGWAKGPKSPKHWYEPLTMEMDLLGTHANGCPMDFAAMLAAEDFHFLHDVAGIAKHINRRTGKLGDCFMPRFHRRPAKINRVA